MAGKSAQASPRVSEATLPKGTYLCSGTNASPNNTGFFVKGEEHEVWARRRLGMVHDVMDPWKSLVFDIAMGLDRLGLFKLFKHLPNKISTITNARYRTINFPNNLLWHGHMCVSGKTTFDRVPRCQEHPPQHDSDVPELPRVFL